MFRAGVCRAGVCAKTGVREGHVKAVHPSSDSVGAATGCGGLAGAGAMCRSVRRDQKQHSFLYKEQVVVSVCLWGRAQ